jgi:hypothetical protein
MLSKAKHPGIRERGSGNAEILHLRAQSDTSWVGYHAPHAAGVAAAASPASAPTMVSTLWRTMPR